MRSIRDGLLAGALAGLLLVVLLFFDEGPANQLTLVAQSLGLDGRGGSKGVAALLIFVLAALIGGLFGALRRQPGLSRAWTLFWGLVAGALGCGYPLCPGRQYCAAALVLILPVDALPGRQPGLWPGAGQHLYHLTTVNV